MPLWDNFLPFRKKLTCLKLTLTLGYYFVIISHVSRDNGRLAQLGERLPYKQDVGGSIPSSPTIMELWCRGLTCLPVTQEIAGSTPVSSAINEPMIGIGSFYFSMLILKPGDWPGPCPLYLGGKDNTC